MIEKPSMPSLVTIQHAIQTAEKEIKRFVDAESDPMLCAILRGRIELSISNIADSIEKNFLEGSVIKQCDGSIDPLQSTVTTGFLEWVGLTLERTKTSYLSQHDPENSSAIHAGCIFFRFSIREEWNSWAIKQQLLADEAIPLMNGLDPKSWKEYKKEIKHLPDEMVFSIERSLQLANNEGFNNKIPTEWLAWGREHDLDKPIIKSADWLKEPNVCMFSFFESAVNEISKSAIRSDETHAATKAEANKIEMNIENPQPNSELISGEQVDQEICDLFDPMSKKAIALLFDRVKESDWRNYFSRAARNGLRKIRENESKYNPVKIAGWLVDKGLYTREYANRRLANNLPERNRDKKHLITGDFD